MAKKIFWTIVTEFGIQFILSLIYAYWQVKNSASFNTLDFIKNFGASFFILSWFSGQFVRIKKNIKVETKLEELVTKLEGTGNQIINKMLGLDSFVYATIGQINSTNDEGHIIFLVEGPSPVYEVGGYYYDENTKTNTSFMVGTHSPNVSVFNGKIKLDKTKDIRLNFFFNSRRGYFHSGLRLKFKDNKWHSAIHVSTLEKFLYFKLSENFPEDLLDSEIEKWSKDA